MIVGLCGLKRSGKSTLSGLINRHYGYGEVAFADALRNAVYATNPLIDVDGTRVQDAIDLYGYEGVKTTKYAPEFRRLMQAYGTQGVRDNVSDTAWVDVVLNMISDGDNWVVGDVRFPNELEAVKSFSDSLSVWVHRPGLEGSDGHSSENSIKREDCEFTIYNHGTPSDMMRQFKEIMSDLD